MRGAANVQKTFDRQRRISMTKDNMFRDRKALLGTNRCLLGLTRT
jgi:hypothetical protein